MAAHLLGLRAVFKFRAWEGTGSRSAEMWRAGADARAVVLIGRGCGRFVGACQPGLPCTMSPARRRSGSAPRRQLGMVGQAGSPFLATSSARPSHRLGSLQGKSLGGLRVWDRATSKGRSSLGSLPPARARQRGVPSPFPHLWLGVLALRRTKKPRRDAQ